MGYLVVLLIALVIGYFVDLPKGQTGWFIGRLVFMLSFYHIMTLITG